MNDLVKEKNVGQEEGDSLSINALLEVALS